MQESLTDINLCKLPPQNIEIEQAILAACLLDHGIMQEAIEILHENLFYRTAHVKIFKAIKAVKSCDINLIIEHIKINNELESIGGASTISKILDVPMAIDFEKYAQILISKKKLRDLIAECNKILNIAFDAKRDAAEIIDQAQKNILKIEFDEFRSPFKTAKEFMNEVVDNIQSRQEKDNINKSVTGFIDLDLILQEFQPGELIILAARPSMGKTALMLNMAYNMAKIGVNPAIFSMEMQTAQLAERLLSMRSKINSQRLKSGNLGRDDWKRIIVESEKIGENNILIDDKGGQHISEVKRGARLAKKEGAKIIFLDYLQLIRGDGKSRNEEIGGISRALKAIAKELDLPIVALAQLNRGVEQRDNKRPRMSDLRDSGEIEQDADSILFIYRDEVYNPDTPEKGVAEILVSKNRNGPTGTVRLAWIAQYTKFENLQVG